MVLSVLLYGAETWASKAKEARKLKLLPQPMCKVNLRCNTIQAMEGEAADQAPSRSFWFAEINTGHHSGATLEMARSRGLNGWDKTS